MSTITKEWLQQKIADMEAARDEIPFGLDEDDSNTLAALRIALASLEAEAVCVIDQSNLDYLKSGADADVWPASRKEMGDVLLYRTTPPAPANAEPVAWLWSHRKHPSEVTLVRPEDDEMAEGSRWSGWSCQALYAAPPAPASVPDGYRLQPISEYDAMCAAMLQGADGNSPAHSGCRPAQNVTPPAQCGNSPVIQDGWRLVPEEPTHEMLEAGDEQFGTYDVYRRMIAASPQQK
ncbi:TPA: ead/Ea22-like family protein [Enterobacter cloacae subsp. cloacae]